MTPKKIPWFLFLAVLFLSACPEKSKAPRSVPPEGTKAVSAPSCTYSANPADILLEWTGYKFTQKKGATGKFLNFKVEGGTSAATLADLMKGLSVSVDASAISTGDPARDATLQDFFFGKLNPPHQLTATIDKVEGDESKGTLSVRATMNGQSQVLPLAYTGDPQAGTITATGGLDILQFGAKPALDSIHETCVIQHTGEDGVAKTWNTVDLKLTGKYQKVCK